MNYSRLPPGWIVAAIEKFAHTATGGTPSRAVPAYFGGTIPWVKSGELGDGLVQSTEDTLSELGVKSSNAKVFPRGTLCIALYGATVGKVGILDMDATTNQAVCGIFLPDGVDTRYMFNFLLSMRRELIKQGKGGAQSNISNGIVRQLPVPLAPPAEQLRIVAKIEELFSDLDAGVSALERVRANLKRYRAAVLKAAVEGRLTEAWRTRHPATEPAAALLERILAERGAKWEQDQLRKFKESGKTPPKGWKENFEDSSAPLIGGLGSLPPGWSWSNIDRIADVQGGIQKQPKRAPASNAYPYLRVANVRRDQLLLDDLEKFELFPGELERLRLEPNDLLIVEGNGSLTEIGRSAIWRGEIPNCVHQNHIIRVRPLGGMVTGFVNMYWNSPNGAKRVMAEAASTSGLYTLSVTKVCRLPVPIPPLAEQAQIVAEVDRRLSVADAAETQVEHALQRAARLRQAILKRAFEGKLVPQDPTDEPAAALRERIKAPSNDKPPAPAKPATRRSRARV
jgi:type I restriction enzyme, S subunit